MAASGLQTIKKVLIANRGEIAVRCIRACKTLGVTSVSIYTSSDAASLHVTLADEFVQLSGDGTAGYLDVDDILRICKSSHIDAVIPGYGFLSENVEFAQRVKDAGMVFVGPSAESITEMGLKHRAREVAIANDVPVVPGSNGLVATEEEALAEAERLTYPIMLKATGGGGGMGLQICHSSADIRAAFAMVRNRGETLFKNSGILLEKYYPRSRHIEVQVFGNGTHVVHFGERECSLQRRHQKVIEECPSPFVVARPGLRQQLTSCAIRYAEGLGYKSAGTVEFLVDDDTGSFFFLEMNTRLQVEHGITELCYGVDLVVLMLRQADLEMSARGGIPSEELQALQKDEPNGAAIEARLYAEDPYRKFAPSPGVFQEVRWPQEEGVRIDTWIQSGQDISLNYDPLLAKAMVHSATREEAIAKMDYICSEGISLKGPRTNLHFCRAIINSDIFARGATLTSFLDTQFSYEPSGIDIISSGPYSTIQDFPARSSVGHGIPKGGPMDSLSPRVANLLVGNPDGQEVIEATLAGPELLFTATSTVSVCGAEAPVHIDGMKQPMWSSLWVEKGQTLKIGKIQGAGCRVYLAVAGGFPDIAVVFGSKSTTPSLGFGGHQGRILRQGDFLSIAPDSRPAASRSLPPSMIPDMAVEQVFVMQGPHDSDDIMTPEDREMLYNSDWKVGHNSSRVAVRLEGPAPKWARKNGGEAGSHPSNYLDYGYPMGGLNWGGDYPCMFSVDSPNFGGLICSSTVISAEMWKLGQLKPGESFRAVPVTFESALLRNRQVTQYLAAVAAFVAGQESRPAASILYDLPRAEIRPDASILATVPTSPEQPLRPKVVYRQGGDRSLIVEFASETTDINIISRIRFLLEKLSSSDMKLLLTEHVGSVTIEYNPCVLSQRELLRRVQRLESSIDPSIDVQIPCRQLRLPIAMDHPEFARCIERYMQTTRDKAAYLPDNLDYLRKANGLDSRRAVFDMILKTEYLVAAVGFLCGMPMLYPLSPITITGQKYNPTRVSTPAGTLGLGGSLLCGYTTEQPGGYMLLARTLPAWDAYGTRPGFAADRPWLFEPFDKVTFYKVSVEEYDTLMTQLVAGRYEWQISSGVFDVRQAFEAMQGRDDNAELVEYKRRQVVGLAEQNALEDKLYASWKAEKASDLAVDGVEDNLHAGAVAIRSPMPANVWKIEVKVGDIVKEGQVLAVLEAMKMEVNVATPQSSAGFAVRSIKKRPGTIAYAGDELIVLEPVSRT